MSETHKVVILANSTKGKEVIGGRCVAGFDLTANKLIRLIGNSKDGALRPETVRYQNRSECKILDVVEVKIEKPFPEKYQKENYLIEEKPYNTFKYIGKFPKENISNLITKDPKDITSRFPTPPLSEDVAKDTNSLAFLLVSDAFVIEDFGINDSTGETYQKNSLLRFKYNDRFSSKIHVTDLNYNKTKKHISYAAILFSSGKPFDKDDKIYTWAAGILELSREDYFSIEKALHKSEIEPDKNKLKRTFQEVYGEDAVIKFGYPIEILAETEDIKEFYEIHNNTINGAREFFNKHYVRYGEPVPELVILIKNKKSYAAHMNPIVRIIQILDFNTGEAIIENHRKDGTVETKKKRISATIKGRFELSPCIEEMYPE